MARWMMKGAEEWSLRSMVGITALMLGCIVMIVVIGRLEAAQQPGPDAFRPVDAVLVATSVTRIGPVVLETDNGMRLTLPHGLRGPALQDDLEAGRRYTFLVEAGCIEEARTRCDVWGIDQGPEHIAPYAMVRGAWDRGQRVPYVLLLTFFSLAALTTGAQVWLRLRGWKPTIPGASLSSPRAREVKRPPLSDSGVREWLGSVQAQIKRGDRRITVGVLVGAVAVLAATKLDLPIWEKSFSVTWFAVACTVVFSGLAVWDIQKQRRPLSWVRSTAYVYHVSVLRQDNGYIPAVLYEYGAGAQTQRGFRVHINGPQGRLVEALQNARQYSEGTEVDCYYDPAKPDLAVLDRSFTWTTVKVSAAFCVGSWVFAYVMS